MVVRLPHGFKLLFAANPEMISILQILDGNNAGVTMRETIEQTPYLDADKVGIAFRKLFGKRIIQKVGKYRNGTRWVISPSFSIGISNYLQEVNLP